MKKRRSKKSRSMRLTLNSKVKYFYTVADGSRVYTNRDAEGEYKNNKIHDPKRSTYVNLFVNGVLQPEELFKVRKGKLVFKSDDAPEEGTPIVLQFVKLSVKKKRRGKSKKRKSRGRESSVRKSYASIGKHAKYKEE